MKVVGLVGPSGTGKSHRAAEVAAQVGAQLIVDDGLLIAAGRILAGRSAKRETTRIGAVRRAIFQDPADAAAVSDALRERPGETVLVLGTSREMVERIVSRLTLSLPDEWLEITEVATSSEIDAARRVRRREGKHVIPALTLEVRKGFSGYLVDPLRFLLRSAQGRPRVVEKSIVRPTYSALGRFTIGDAAVAQLAARSALAVAGVERVLHVSVGLDEAGVRLGLDLVVRRTALFSLLERVQTTVRSRVEELSALNVLAVDVIAKALAGGHRRLRHTSARRGPPRRSVPARRFERPAGSP